MFRKGIKMCFFFQKISMKIFIQGTSTNETTGNFIRILVIHFKIEI